MKKLMVLIATVLVLSAVGFVVAQPETVSATVANGQGHPTVTIPAHAVELAPGVFDIGTAVVNGQVVHGIAFIHYKEGFTHRPGHGGAPGGSTCYAFLASGAKWKVTEDYILDSANVFGLSDAFVASGIETGANAWDGQVAFDVFGSRTAGVVDGADTVQPDTKNEVYFGSIDDAGAIAVTIVWGIFSGPPGNRKLVEWDQVYDQVDFAWGDATINTAVMDFLNIAVHEIGHAGGMGHPSGTCTEETMYAYATEGETKKRDLNAGDIAGIKALYK